MKKLLTILLSLLVVFTLAGCNNGSGEGGNGGGEGGNTAAGPYKIGVATIFEGETWEIQRRYFEEELAPLFNMEFLFSERINDDNALMDFIDQAYAADCVGIINFRTQQEPVAQAARKCQEYGMYFVTQNSKLTEEVADLEYNVGHCGADPIKMADQYKVLFKDLLSDGEPHSIFLYSYAAVGQMAASHYYSTAAILEAYQEAYGLTYDMSIDELVNRQEPGPVNTGRDDVKIYLYPGLQPDEAVVAAQAQLQTGEYDTFASVASFNLFTSMIDDIEKAQNRDIRIVGTIYLDDYSKTGFETKDSLGNQVLTAGILNPVCPADGVNALELYNALNGGNDAMKENGKAVLLGVGPFIVKDAETYAGVGKLDSSHETYVLNSDDLKPLMVTENPNVTYKDIDAALHQIADVDYVLNKAGLN